ncbi:MAG: diguanylate cyclase [Xanthomonadales bacterium]|nr:diguanylate cyclase [Xanthomonadales bacterium]
MNRISIGTALTKRVLWIGAIATLVTCLLLITRVYLEERASARRHLEEIKSTLVPALTTALWEVDPQRIDDLLDGVAQRPGVSTVALESAEGEQWRSGSDGDDVWMTAELPLIHPAQPQRPLGSLAVSMGRDHGIGRVLRQLPLVVTIVMLAIFGAAWEISRQFRRRVSAPLQALAAQARRFDGDDLSRPFRLTPQGEDFDEIAQLVASFEQARQRLQSGIARQTEQADALRRHGEELEQKVARRTADLNQRVNELRQAHDATEHARAQAERFAARASDFAEISADGFWETDAQLRLVLVSPYFARLMGSSVEQMLGKTPVEAYRDRYPDAKGLEAYFAPLQQREAFEDQMLWLEDAQGERHWVVNKGKPIFDRDGVFQGFRGVITDITESRNAERALQASERRFRLITDSVPALISYIDGDRRFRFNNRVYQDWLDKPLSEITDRRLDEVYDAEVYARIEPHLETAFAGERVVFDMELAGRTYRATYVPDTDSHGRTVGIFGLIHDITRLKRVERDLRLAADFDALTGLPNRRHFEQLLEQAIQRAEGAQSVLALLFIDLDHFKAINDQLGHAAGDAVLRHLANQLRGNLRATDTPARLAGDEFVVILEGLRDAQEAGQVAAKLLRAIAQPMDLGSVQRPISASLGVAVRASGEMDAEVLLRRADSALYQAKEAGRGCFRMAQAEAVS